MQRSPFHAGERAIQARVGVRERTENAGRRMIRDAMPDQHRELFEKLPYLIAGGSDEDGRPWATMLTGAPGFVHTPDDRTLLVAARPSAVDPAAPILRRGSKIGLLGIELATRRRNRVNGLVITEDALGFAVHVEQSFGNCPQYIQARALLAPAPRTAVVVSPEPPSLSEEAAALVSRADTFFIATTSLGAAASADRDGPEHGVDVSHRGGRPGFVRLTQTVGAAVLTWPDFRGNFMFNTLGNLELDPRAGLYFVDFESGSALSLSGVAEVIWDGPELRAFEGAERLVRFEVAAAVLLHDAVPFRWSSPELAPQLAKTGTW